jgi:hypothetical protein
MEDWFEAASGGGRTFRVSKFLRADFVVPAEVVAAEWPSWTPREKEGFASAFAHRVCLDENDRWVLDFLMERGGLRIWRSLAPAIAKHPNRSRAMDFLLARVSEGGTPSANFYQALGTLLSPESAPVLCKALSQHQLEIQAHPFVESWTDRLLYLDYLSCSATLFLVTGKEEYRDNLKEMLQHRDQSVRRLAEAVAATSGVDPHY